MYNDLQLTNRTDNEFALPDERAFCFQERTDCAANVGNIDDCDVIEKCNANSPVFTFDTDYITIVELSSDPLHSYDDDDNDYNGLILTDQSQANFFRFYSNSVESREKPRDFRAIDELNGTAESFL